MFSYWYLLAAFAACNIFVANCDANPADQDGVKEGLSRSVVGYKPCLDEICETYGPVPLDTPGTKVYYKPPKGMPPPVKGKTESPRVHCILLRPSAVEKFGKVEAMHPGISDIKYSVLEDLIDFMYQCTSLKLNNCDSTMKLVDLIYVAAHSLRNYYLHHGSEECVWEASEMPESLKPTEEPYKPSTTQPSKPEQSYPSSKRPTVEKPYVPSTEKSTPHSENPSVEDSYEPCETPSTTTHKPLTSTKETTTERPCEHGIEATEENIGSKEVEIIAEAPQVGSMRGIPGVHYPNYTDIPITSFTCADKKHVPGFYADLDTSCQVFHVCYEHRRESFLCPIGTIFNQPILACDYWYSSNCSLSSSYYDVNERTELDEENIDKEVDELLTTIAEKPEHGEQSVEKDLEKITPFFPVKVVVVVDTKHEVSIKPTTPDAETIAAEIVDKMATKGTKVVSNTRSVIQSIPEPVKSKPIQKPDLPVFKKPVKINLAAVPIAKVATVKTALPGVATKKASIPIIAAAKAKLATKIAAMPAMKMVVASPVVAKTKVASAAVPVAKVAAAKPVLVKSKMAVAAPAIIKGKIAVPAVKMVASKTAAKSIIPIMKAKMVASAVPLAKAKIVPLMKGAGVPLSKAKMFALPLAKNKLAGPIPLVKAKMVKAAAISPLTKKALALGYMKLLKAKKVALMG